MNKVIIGIHGLSNKPPEPTGDYAANSDGVKVVDKLIANDWGGIYHKSYGYLRAPEVSQVIQQFI